MKTTWSPFCFAQILRYEMEWNIHFGYKLPNKKYKTQKNIEELKEAIG